MSEKNKLSLLNRIFKKKQVEPEDSPNNTKLSFQIDTTIDDEMYESLTTQLLNVVATHDTRDIVLYINSRGGYFHSAKGLVQFLRAMPNKITTVTYGECCSAACMIFAVGEERYLMDGTTYMIHQPKSVIEYADLQLKDLAKIQLDLEKIHEEYRDFVMSGSKIPLDEFNKYLKDPEDTILSNEEISKYEVATKIFYNWNEIDI